MLDALLPQDDTGVEQHCPVLEYRRKSGTEAGDGSPQGDSAAQHVVNKDHCPKIPQPLLCQLGLDPDNLGFRHIRIVAFAQVAAHIVPT